MKTQTIAIRPEIDYPCPFCSSYFSNKRSLKGHIAMNLCSGMLDFDRDIKYKIKFLKPK